ncbi:MULTISPECIES: DUF2897 family protein [Marinobacter]|uniref:DUF2897 family protein n=1 Tax=Marinobacter TaxID=2742 RepID=UPI000DAE0E5C|nr:MULTISPECIES: DUF2897 family protein [Marinobacter]
MPLTGWFFLVLAIVLVVGGLLILRDNARNSSIPEDKLEAVRKRKAEMEAKDKAEEDDW